MDIEESLIIKEMNSYNFDINKEKLSNLVNIYKIRKDKPLDLIQYDILFKDKNIFESLKTNINEGIKEESIRSRIDKFGSHESEKKDIKSIKQLIIESLEDFTLRILLCAAFFSILINFINEGGYLFWVEGFAIFMAVFVSCCVQAINDYQKEKEFLELNKIINNGKLIKIIRNNKIIEILKDKIVVGDIIIIVNGMEIPADCILIEGYDIKTDDSSLTGETKSIQKETYLKCLKYKNKQNINEIPTFLLFEGSNIVTGCGKLIVIAVGKESSLGKIKETLIEEENELTPLQLKLEKIARDIGYFGLFSAIIIFIILLIKLVLSQIRNEYIGLFPFIKEVLQYFIISITILVVAIPEGLPLAVTISLAFSVKKMMNDNNLVRKLQACETMGGANIICSDKTGTLTKNEMHWTNFYSEKQFDIYDISKGVYNQFPFKNDYFKDIFIKNISLNSLENPKNIKGNPTELSLLKYLDYLKYDIVQIRNNEDQKFICPFSSERKRMSSVYKIDDKFIVFMKGASEQMLEICDNKLNMFNGEIEKINKNEILKEIEFMAKKTLRTIGLIYKILDEEPNYELKNEKNIMNYELNGFTFIGIVGIKDVIRPEVSDAIKICNDAGIEVKMITGDNKFTAEAIAKEINIINDNKSLVMEGIDFYNFVGGLICDICGDNCKCKNKNLKIKYPAKFKEIASKLKVLARSRPEDKYCLVIGLKNLNNVVAVTGDGTNDALALKKADVGFAMNLTGTDLARQSADILILDDNFYSIVQSVKWGRNIYDSIRKFLQFQLTVNIVAVMSTFISSCLINVPILNTVQMLWVNLIMDTLASLALATEPPTNELLKRKPHKRNDSMVNKTMGKHIIIQCIYQIIVLLLLVFKGNHFLPEYRNRGQKTSNNLITIGGEISKNGLSPSVHFTYIFNIFVIMQIFNFISMRKLNDEKNVFDGILKSKFFIIIWITIFILQIIFITFGNNLLKVVSWGLDFYQWVICILFGLFGMLINLLTKFIKLEKYIPEFGNKELNIDDLNKISSINIKRGTNKRTISKMSSIIKR